MVSEDLSAQVERLVDAALDRPVRPVSVGEPLNRRDIATQLEHADELAAVDELPHQRRLGGAKQLVMRIARLFLHRQAAFNRQVVGLVRMVDHQLETHSADADQRVSAMSAAHVDLELLVEEQAAVTERTVLELMARVDELVVDLSKHVELLDALVVRVDGQQARLARVDASVAGLTSLISDALGQDQTRPGAADVDVSNVLATSFERVRAARYALFEDRLRGSEADIRAGLVPYLDDVLAGPTVGGDVLDIGCGRGEWLRLLRDRGIPARGIDLNVETVEAAVASGLDVVHGDGIEHLARLDEGSLGVLTAFHVLEHLAVEDHNRFFEAAARALRPSGLLIVETPNPTNLIVGAAAFYCDPSHVRPIHPDYLGFLADACGFVDAEIRFLHPRAEYERLAGETEDPVDREVLWAIFGPQDLALVARRP
jgi:O-antigen chain-terminating methyltransferase